ncbi:MAG: cation:proton antiporter [Nitrospirae bacterium]|nr:cation:proton antiporter [Nitrospirota bacterium]
MSSAGGPAPLVQDIGFCLILSGILCVLFTRLKIPTIAAFLVAGVLVGPEVGGFVTDKGNIETIASLGLTLLLLVIGLEMDVKKLLESGKTLILSGLLQFPLCVAFGYAVTLALRSTGWSMVSGTYVPIYVGFTVAASSTLLVVKLLQEKYQMDTVVGRVGLGILIFQDIWSIVVLAVQPNFQNPEMGTVGLTFLGIGIVLLTSILLAKYVLPTAFKWIAKTPELMLVVATGWCFGLGAFGANLEHILALIGIHLHLSVTMEMGALIAGATIAGLPYAHEVVTKVAVVRDFFVTLFFVGLGMGIPRPESIDILIWAAILGAICVLARYVVFFPLMYFTGLDRRNAFVGATKLAQISEFCLVIAYLGLGFDHLESRMVSAVIFGFVITALGTPALFVVADTLHDRLGSLLSLLGFKIPPVIHASASEEESPEVVLLGFHRVASSLLHEIKRTRPEMLKRMLVIDFNVALHAKISATGARVKYGDISNTESLHHLGIDQAQVIICTIQDDVLKGTSNTQLARNLRHLNPTAMIIVNAVTLDSVPSMYRAGANYVYLARIETATALVPAIEAGLGGQESLESYKRGQEAARGVISSREEALP